MTFHVHTHDDAYCRILPTWRKMLTLSRYKSPDPIRKLCSILHLSIFPSSIFFQRKFSTDNDPYYPFVPTTIRKDLRISILSIKNKCNRITLDHDRFSLTRRYDLQGGRVIPPSIDERTGNSNYSLISSPPLEEARAFASPWNGTRSRTRARVRLFYVRIVPQLALTIRFNTVIKYFIRAPGLQSNKEIYSTSWNVHVPYAHTRVEPAARKT